MRRRRALIFLRYSSQRPSSRLGAEMFLGQQQNFKNSSVLKSEASQFFSSLTLPTLLCAASLALGQATRTTAAAGTKIFFFSF